MTNAPMQSPQPTARGHRIFSLRSLIALALSVTFIIFLATSFDLDWTQTWDNVRTMDPRFYAAALALYYLSFLFRGIRWRLLALNAGLLDSPRASLPGIPKFSQLILVGWFVNSVAWLRLGDAYRAYALSKESSNKFSFTLGTVVAERAVDMATILFLIIVGVGAYSLTQNLKEILHIVAASMVMSAALALLLAMMRGYGRRLAHLLPARLEGVYQQFHQGAIRSIQQIPVIFALGLISWMLEVGRLYFIVQALNASVGLSLILITALGHAILSTVPTPGGVGAVEPGVTGLLMIDLAKEDAVSVAIVDRSVTYLSVLLIGGLALLVLQASQSRHQQASETTLITDMDNDTCETVRNRPDL